MFYAENSQASDLDEAIEISDDEDESVPTPPIESTKNVQNIPSLLRLANRKDFTVRVDYSSKQNADDDFDNYFIKLLEKIDNGWKCKECTDKFSFRKVAEKHIRTIHMKDKNLLQNQVTQILKNVPGSEKKSNFSHYPNRLKSILKNSNNSLQFSKVPTSGEFTCDVCGVVCNNKTRFRNHTMTYKHYFTCTHCESTYRKRDELRRHNDVCQNKKAPVINKPNIQARTSLPAKHVGAKYKPNPHKPSATYSHYPSGPASRRPPMRPFSFPKSPFEKRSYICHFCGWESDPEKISSSYSPNKNTFTCESCGKVCSKTKSKALNQWQNAHAPVGYARGSQNYKTYKAADKNTPAGLLASLFPQGYQGIHKTPQIDYSQSQQEVQNKIEDEDENKQTKDEVSSPQEVKTLPKTWEAAEDKGFPVGWKWRLSNPWSRRLKFMSPEEKVFASRIAAAKYMENQGGYTPEQIEKAKNSDDQTDQKRKDKDCGETKDEVVQEDSMEEETGNAPNDVSLEDRIEKIRKSIDDDFDTALSGTKVKQSEDSLSMEESY